MDYEKLAAVPIHFAVNDMQVAEDTQLVVGHLCRSGLATTNQRTLSPRLMAEVDL